MATKYEIINNELVKLYVKEKPDAEYVLCKFGEIPGTGYGELLRMKFDAQRKRKKGLQIEEVKLIKNDLIQNYAFGLRLNKATKNKNLSVEEMSGIFKIVFNDGSFIFYARWISGFGKSKEIESMFAAEKEVWHKFLLLMSAQKKLNLKPKSGIFKAHLAKDAFGNLTVSYEKYKNPPTTPIIHPCLDELYEDINFFFENTSLFTRYGMPGSRKAIIVGEPGTGKSSAAIRVAKKYMKEKSIVFCNDIRAAFFHLKNCSKYNVSTIVILEDAEQTLQGASSDVLNFLDGVNQPVNKNGSYIIMTTNHPQRLEPRIIKRPGRIDKIISMGPLEGDYAINCAKIYFTEFDVLKDKRKAYDLFNNLTGAQIKELAQSSVKHAVSTKSDISYKLIKEVKNIIKESLAKVFTYGESDSDLVSEKPTTIGFSPVISNKQEIDWDEEEIEKF